MTSVTSELNPLGKVSAYKDQYDPSLLFPIERSESWKAQGLDRNAVPFFGEDIWNGYEISWLNNRGKPIVCMAEFRIPAASRFLIESKSFKLYLNSFNQSRFDSEAEVLQRMINDSSAAAGAPVEVIFHPLDAQFPAAPAAHCLDELDIDVQSYQPDASLLTLAAGQFDGWLCSHLLKSNCPVTGQPDWGSLYIPAITAVNTGICIKLIKVPNISIDTLPINSEIFAITLSEFCFLVRGELSVRYSFSAASTCPRSGRVRTD